MNERSKQFDKFSEEFFKKIKLIFETTDINVIGNKVEVPINERIAKLCMLYTDKYVSEYHRDVDFDTLLTAMKMLEKKEMIDDTPIQLAKKKSYNEALLDVRKVINIKK